MRTPVGVESRLLFLPATTVVVDPNGAAWVQLDSTALQPSSATR